MKEEERTNISVKYKNGYIYREAYKIAVILDLVGNQESASFIARKHGLPTTSLSSMRRELLEQQGYFRILDSMKNKEQTEKTAQELATENAELKKALELSILKVAALETLIDVVDNQLNIDIRKKGESKPSK
jgi:transposase-like protein